MRPAAITRVPAPAAAEPRQDDIVVLALPLLPLLSATTVPRIGGLLALAAIAARLLVVLGRRSEPSDCRAASRAFLVVLGAGALAGVASPGAAVVQIVQLSLVALALRVGPLLQFSPGAPSRSLSLAGMVGIVLLLDVGLERNLIFENANAVGTVALCALALAMKLRSHASRPGLALLVVLLMLLGMLSDSRASVGAMVVLLGWPTFSKLVRGKGVRRAVLTMGALVPVALLVGVATDRLDVLYDYVPLVGDKTPFSGRDVIWLSIFLELEANGYRGGGLGAHPGKLLEGHYEGLSAHNGYIQILYQLGILGLVLFLVACGLALRALWRRNDGGVSATILLAALLHDMFEVALTQNHFGSGLSLWLAAAMQPPSATAPTPARPSAP